MGDNAERKKTENCLIYHVIVFAAQYDDARNVYLPAGMFLYSGMTINALWIWSRQKLFMKSF